MTQPSPTPDDVRHLEPLARKFIVPLGYHADADWKRIFVGNMADSIDGVGSLYNLCLDLARAATDYPRVGIDRERKAIALLDALERESGVWVAVRVENEGWEIIRPRSQEALKDACATTERPTDDVRRLFDEAGALIAKLRNPDFWCGHFHRDGKFGSSRNDLAPGLAADWIAAAREGWPADRERADRAEARVRELEAALGKAATRFNHCAEMIAISFDASGTQRAERTIKAKHYALEALAALENRP